MIFIASLNWNWRFLLYIKENEFLNLHLNTCIYKVKIIFITLKSISIQDMSTAYLGSHLKWAASAVEILGPTQCPIKADTWRWKIFSAHVIQSMPMMPPIQELGDRFWMRCSKTKLRWHTHSERSRWASSATHILGQRHSEVGWPVPFFAVVVS